jgi:hypothetical protein
MQLFTKLRRFQKVNFCARASRSQAARFSILALSAAAISPGLVGFGLFCASAGITLSDNRTIQATACETLGIRVNPVPD